MGICTRLHVCTRTQNIYIYIHIYIYIYIYIYDKKAFAQIRSLCGPLTTMGHSQTQNRN